MNYLSLLFISAPLVASNQAGENEGNVQTLQVVRTSDGERTVLSGYSLRYAIRAAMEKLGAHVWRHTTDDGFSYGDAFQASMKDAGPPDPKKHKDGAFGYMVAAKKAKDGEGGTLKIPSAILVSPALSTTPFVHDTAFVRGMKADGETNPFGRERHHTRYTWTETINVLDAEAKGFDINCFLAAHREGLSVGGSHAANAATLIPEILAWRFHAAPGQGGLYLGAGTNFPVSDANPLDLSALNERARNLGFDFHVAGRGQGKTVSAALDQIKRDYAAILGTKGQK